MANETHRSVDPRSTEWATDMRVGRCSAVTVSGVGSRIASRAALAGVAVCAAMWLGALVLPFYSGSSVSSSTRSSDGTMSSSSVRAMRHETLVQMNGTRILIVLLIPLVIALVGLLGARGIIPRVGLVAAVTVIWLWTVITGFSVGLLYIPAAVALTVAAIASPQTPRATRPRLVKGA